MMTPAFPPFQLTATELTSFISGPGPHTFRRRHVIDTGDGRFLCEEIHTSRTICSSRRDPATGQIVETFF